MFKLIEIFFIVFFMCTTTVLAQRTDHEETYSSYSDMNEYTIRFYDTIGNDSIYYFDSDQYGTHIFHLNGINRSVVFYGNVTMMRNLTMSEFNVAGFVKNDASGLLSDGNSITITDIDSFTEAQLETRLSDVIDVFTDNDGALDDDDVTLGDVQGACTNDFHNIGGTDATDDTVSGTELDTLLFGGNGLLRKTGANTFDTITDNSANWDTAYSWGDWSGDVFWNLYGNTLSPSTSDNNVQFNGSIYFKEATTNMGITSLVPRKFRINTERDMQIWSNDFAFYGNDLTFQGNETFFTALNDNLIQFYSDFYEIRFHGSDYIFNGVTGGHNCGTGEFRIYNGVAGGTEQLHVYGDESQIDINATVNLTRNINANNSDAYFANIFGNGAGLTGIDAGLWNDDGGWLYPKLVRSIKINETVNGSNGEFTFLDVGNVNNSGNNNVTGYVSASNFTSTIATGTSPYATTSTTLNTNLNADMLDGKHVGTDGNVVPLLDGTNIWTGTNRFKEDVTISGDTKNDEKHLFLRSYHKVGFATWLPSKIYFFDEVANRASIWYKDYAGGLGVDDLSGLHFKSYNGITFNANDGNSPITFNGGTTWQDDVTIGIGKPSTGSERFLLFANDNRGFLNPSNWDIGGLLHPDSFTFNDNLEDTDFIFNSSQGESLVIDGATGDVDITGVLTLNETILFEQRAIQVHNESTIDTVSADTWVNISWNLLIDNETTDGFALDDNNESIVVNHSGLYRVQGCLHPYNNGIGNQEANLFSRVLINLTEVRCLQYANNKEFKSSGIDTMPFTGTVYISSGQKLNLQYQVSNTDIDFEGDAVFDNPVSASINLERIN